MSGNKPALTKPDANSRTFERQAVRSPLEAFRQNPLVQMLRPAHAKSAATTAATWLMPGLRGEAVPEMMQPARLGKIGALEVRLAQTKNDVKRAQKLRYKVFYKNGSAIADAATMLAQRDKDAFDKSAITCWWWITPPSRP